MINTFIPLPSFPPPFIKGTDGDSWLLDDATQQWYSWLSQLPDWATTQQTIT